VALGEISSDRQMVDESVKFTPISERFNHTEGDIANDLSLDLSLKASAIEFTTSDLDNLVAKETTTLIPAGYQQADGINHSFTLKNIQDKQVELTIQVSSLLLPQLDKTQIVKDISGKFPTAVKDYFTSLPGVSQISFQFSPPLPRQILTLPHVPKNINLVVKPGN
jgi:hypothetical protein